MSVVWSQNHWDGFSRFGLKTGGDGFSLFGIKTSGDRVSRFRPPNRQPRFGDLGYKIIATVSWFGRQNQAGYGLSIAAQN
jgi:hypothetical protein